MDLELRDINDGFARQVVGIDLWDELDDLIVSNIANTLSNVGVLVFRRQSLSEHEMVEFTSKFGELELIVRSDWASTVIPEVTYLSNLKDAKGKQIGRPGTGELEWHSDQSYQTKPATGTFLYSVEVPSQGGSTYFANLHLAYEALPKNLKDKIEDRKGIFSYARRVKGYEQEKKLSKEMKLKTPDVTHLLVQRHPLFGWKSLYLDPSTVIGVDGMEDGEAHSLLTEIITHAEKTQFVYRHDWQVGDLVMCDNGFTMHRRDPFDPAEKRFLKRTSLRLPSDRHIVPD